MAKNKRTPKGKIGDARKSADADWEVEKIVAVATGKDGNRYLVRWKGYGEKHDTYEPEKNLAGAKKLLEDFRKERAEEACANAEVTKAKHDAALEKQRDEREVTCFSHTCTCTDSSFAGSYC